MALPRSALLLAALCCVALVGCPKVTEVKGRAFEVAEGAAGPVDRGLAQGTKIDEGATIRVEAGSAVTIDFDDGCTETYEAGTHTVSNPCAADREDDDLDRNDDDEESRDEREPRSEDATPPDPSQAIAPPSSALATTGIILGSVAGIVAIIETTQDDANPPPLSP